MIELDGLVFGVIGAGRIGRLTAEIARALGMTTLFHSRSSPDSTPLERLLAEADVVSLHCPLTPTTQGLINAERLALMKRSAFLLNTSRGPLLDENAVATALNEGRIAGAGLDVLSIEPPRPDNPLFSARNCLITPHIAWAAAAARKRLLQTAISNLRAFFDGQALNVVN